MSTITSADIEAWVSEMTSSGPSASRTRQAYQVLKGVPDTAVKARNLAANPAQSVDLRKLPQSRRRYLTMAQLEGTTKSGRRREVPLSRFLRDSLAEHLAGKGPDNLVFPARQGGYLRNSNFRRGCFDRAVSSVGLQGLVPHELRHTAASLAIRSGGNIKVVQTMMGHASATMTWDLYGHLYDDDLDRIAERMHDVREEFLRTSCGLSADRATEVRSIRRSNRPLTRRFTIPALVAQGIEQRFPKPCVASSILAEGTFTALTCGYVAVKGQIGYSDG